MQEFDTNKKFKDAMPKMSEAEKEALRDSLRTHGYKGDPIRVWNNWIVDGYVRYDICREEGIEYEVEDVEFENEDQAVMWKIHTHLGHRHLNPAQRVIIALKYEPIYRAYAKAEQIKAGKERHKRSDSQQVQVDPERMNEENQTTDVPYKDEEKAQLTPELGQAENGEAKTEGESKSKAEGIVQKKKRNPTTNAKIALLAVVSEETVRKVKIVCEKGSEELKKRMYDDEISVSAAYNVVMGKNSGKVTSFPNDCERIQKKYEGYVLEMKDLSELQFTNDDGVDVTEDMKSEIITLIELINETQAKLSGLTISNGIVKLASNQ